MQISTVKFQEMLGKAIKGCGNNKLIPITSLISVEVKDKQLRLVTTDATNYLYIIDLVEEDDFRAVVDADTLSRLISRTTSEFIELELQDNALKVKGNGEYLIELPLDEEGNMVRYPDPLSKVVFTAIPHIIKAETIKSIQTSVKPALATTLEAPCYTMYYMADKVIGTDTYKIASLEEEMFDTPMVVQASTIDLVGLAGEDVQCYFDEKQIVFESSNLVVYAPVQAGVDDYAVSEIGALVEDEFESSCKITKNALLQVLDRLAIFVQPYDNNAVNFTFESDGVIISSKSSNGVEKLLYEECKNPTEFTCLVDINMLQDQVKAYPADIVHLWYGKDNAIKFTSPGLTQVLALLEEA